ncbi:M1 family metallopeptidase [Salinithrix halophila]|uniref:M1 family metallopeptidase n=2 Tax=Salinithrix halophila TaxID=1485204 RepID=A0ABV8JH35_9BACL
MIFIFLAIALTTGTILHFTNQPNEEKTTPKTEVQADKPDKPKLADIVQPELYGPTGAVYDIDVTYDMEGHRIKGDLSVRFLNNTEKTLKEIHFNVWGNDKTFRKNGGGVIVDQVKVNQELSTFDMEKETDLVISGLSLKPNRQYSVDMKFTVHVPKQQNRFGWDGTTVSLGNWFPILGVYEKGTGWDIDPYYQEGDSFYSLNSDFNVTVTTDKSLKIATTGISVGEPKVNGQTAVHQFKAENVRDFAMQMDPTYKVKSKKVDDVTVNLYYLEKHTPYVNQLLSDGVGSMNLFEEKFGDYPWPELDIVTMHGWFGGMEYPQLVMISVTDKTQNYLSMITAHEVAHQWFYGVVGNNQYDEPWLDESPTHFAALLYEEKLNQLDSVVPVPKGKYRLNSSISVYDTGHPQAPQMFHHMIYMYGGRTINDLRKELGHKTFYRAVKTYVKQYRFGVATTEDFIQTMEKESERDLSVFFKNHRVLPSH